jgi:hypothetical protein
MSMLDKTLSFLCDRVMFFYAKKECPNERKWAGQVRKCYKAMRKMEEFTGILKYSKNME